jgi:hypothetical protein
VETGDNYRGHTRHTGARDHLFASQEEDYQRKSGRFLLGIDAELRILGQMRGIRFQSISQGTIILPGGFFPVVIAWVIPSGLRYLLLPPPSQRIHSHLSKE